MSETPPQAYISKVHLKGYKIIKDLEIDFKPGLNIIIGPNGSGKTNFVDFISLLNRRGYENQLYREMFEAELDCKGIKVFSLLSLTMQLQIKTVDKRIRIKSSTEKQEKKFIFKILEDIESSDPQFNSTAKYVFDGSKMNLSIENSNHAHYDIVDTKKISFSNPLNFMDSKSSIELLHEDSDDYEYNQGRSYDLTVKSAFEDIEDKQYTKLDGFTRLIMFLWQGYDTSFDASFIENLFNYLPSSSPISEVRLDKKIVSSKRNGDEERLSNIINALEFKVNDNWWTWDNLSDGTKRLFYIICEVCSFDGLIFLEEPELGIHPDQLSDLMDFLKEQAKEKQIIITTHSPEVMNILNKDELDRIIVTRFDKEKGTQMHKLSPHKIKKGQIYMKKVGHLSDFWVHSNLEEIDEED